MFQEKYSHNCLTLNWSNKIVNHFLLRKKKKDVYVLDFSFYLSPTMENLKYDWVGLPIILLQRSLQ